MSGRVWPRPLASALWAETCDLIKLKVTLRISAWLVVKISLVCCAVFFTVVSASYQPRPLPFKYGPTHRGVYGEAGAHGGGIDPLTLLLLQKNGGGCFGKILKARPRAHSYYREEWMVLNTNETPNFTSILLYFIIFMCVKTSKLRTKITSINKHF